MRARQSISLWASAAVLLASRSYCVDGFSPLLQSSGKIDTQPLHHSSRNHSHHRSRSFCSPLHISAAPQDDQDLRSDDDNNNQNNNTNNNNDDNKKGDDSVRRGLRRLAQLSLEDYDWRMSLFKEKEADRKVEEYLAGMLGDDASYVRPMDASEKKIGPLGRAEKSAVDWLFQVFDEEGRRARQIVSTDGKLIRPMENNGDLGPLGTIEKNFVEFLNRIRTSETTRAQQGVLRPKDLDESNRGPLGQLELSVVSALRNIKEAELLRMEQSKRRGGEVVRPIDIPGPLGDFEMAVADVIQTERLRAQDGQKREGIIRPKDAVVKGRLGEYEMQAVEAVRQLTDEERERLRSIKRSLEEQRDRLEDKRPMATAQGSLLGVLEALLVGLLRAPAMIFGVIQRVAELLSSERLDEKDQVLLESRRQEETSEATKPSDQS